jgi:siderophore synthetase component
MCNAHQEVLDRVFNALWREGIPGQRRWVHTGKEAPKVAIELESGVEVLAEVTSIDALERVRPRFPLYLRRNSEGELEPLTEPDVLLSQLARDPRVGAKVTSEFKESSRNMALFLSRRRKRATELADIDLSGGFLAGVFSRTSIHGVRPEEYLESWVMRGHTLHPGTKTRAGFSAEDLELYSPELGCEVGLRFLAVARSHLQESAVPGDRFPARWASEIHRAARDAGAPGERYEILPVHPWQLDHVVKRMFAKEFAAGVLIQLDLALPARPLASMRTFAPVDGPDGGHLKLPVAIQATSVLRTITPSTVDNGPRVSTLLRTILERDDAFTGLVETIPETRGVHFRDPGEAENDPEQQRKWRHLACIMRDRSRNSGWVVPNVLLTEHDPVRHEPVARELVERSGMGPTAFFARFAQLSGQVLLPLLARYGIAMEAHAQNTLTLFDGGIPTRWLMRDFGGIKIDSAWLAHLGHQLKLHPGSFIEAEDDLDLVLNFHHSWLQGNLAPLASALSDSYQVPERDFWLVARPDIKDAWRQAAAPIPDQRRQRLEQLLFAQRVRVKALTRMRLSGDDLLDVTCEVSNPLAGLHAA